MRGLLPLVALACFGRAAGTEITAVGPGCVLATVGLSRMTGRRPAEVAGTAIVTHVATGTLGSIAYLRSGQLRQPGTRSAALIPAVTAAVGAPVGVLVNLVAPARL